MSQGKIRDKIVEISRDQVMEVLVIQVMEVYFFFGVNGWMFIYIGNIFIYKDLLLEYYLLICKYIDYIVSLRNNMFCKCVGFVSMYFFQFWKF